MSGEHKFKDGDGLAQTVETTNASEMLVFTDKFQCYKARVGDFADTKISVLGDYLPQALKIILPAMANEFVTLIKETSILSYVGIVEITRQGVLWASRDFATFPAYIGVAVVYLCLTIPLSRVVAYLEKRMGSAGPSMKKRKAGM